MKNILNKLFLTGLLISQGLVFTKSQEQTWRENITENLSLMHEYLDAKYEIAAESCQEKFEQFKVKVEKTKNWIKNNPKKTAAAIAAVIIAVIVARKIMTQEIEPLIEVPGAPQDKLPVNNNNSINNSIGNNTNSVNSQNIVDTNHNYAYLFNPNSNGTGVNNGEGSYPDLDLDLGFQSNLANSIYGNIGQLFNNAANSINPQNAIYDDEK